jgi:hypothetical protein
MPAPAQRTTPREADLFAPGRSDARGGFGVQHAASAARLAVVAVVQHALRAVRQRREDLGPSTQFSAS